MDKKEKAEEIIKKLKKIYPNPKIALNYKTPIELLVAVVLSAQTTDKQVNVVTADLFEKYKSLDDYLKVPLEDFQTDIKHIGLYKGKGKNIKATLEIIGRDYHGKIPDSMEELVKLPGVGRKTANVLLNNIYDKQEGIAVDTHVKRLTNLWGLTEQSDPDKIEKDLMKIVPKSDWKDFTYLVINYGREYCPANCKHTECPLQSFIAVAS